MTFFIICLILVVANSFAIGLGVGADTVQDSPLTLVGLSIVFTLACVFLIAMGMNGVAQ